MGFSICYRKSNDGFLEQVPTAWISNANACKEGLEREVINSLGGDCCDKRDASPSNGGGGGGVFSDQPSSCSCVGLKLSASFFFQIGGKPRLLGETA